MASPQSSRHCPRAAGGSPFDPQRYRERNRIERFFNKLKQFRRIATRYDKLAKTSAAALHLVAAFLIESDKKVENQLVGLAQNLVNADSAAGALSSTMTALAETFNLSLGAAVGAGWESPSPTE